MTLIWAATVTARFGGYPSDYIKNHDWSDLLCDYHTANELNKIDQKKKENEYRAMGLME